MNKNDEQSINRIRASVPLSRYPIAAPKTLVTDGKIRWGTFNGPIEKINLVDSIEPLGRNLPKWLNNLRLKEWQAFQIDSEKFFVLGAIYQTKAVAFNLLSVWDKEERTLKTWQNYALPGKLKMADQLLKSTNHLTTGSSEILIENRLENGTCELLGFFDKRSNLEKVSFKWTLNSNSSPSVVAMPLGENRGLYTHKEVFSACGELKIGSKIYEFGNGNMAIIDDHKGFYPYNLHYDWLTGMEVKLNGDWLAFNLTKNQVTSPVEYNENVMWVNGQIFPLPVVDFVHLADGSWKVTDEEGYVDLILKPQQHLRIKNNLLVSATDYHAPFGVISGKLMDQSGKIYCIENAYGMGEDKTYRL